MRVSQHEPQARILPNYREHGLVCRALVAVDRKGSNLIGGHAVGNAQVQVRFSTVWTRRANGSKTRSVAAIHSSLVTLGVARLLAVDA